MLFRKDKFGGDVTLCVIGELARRTKEESWADEGNSSVSVNVTHS